MAVEEPHRVRCRLNEVLDRRGLTLTDLSRMVDVTLVNLSVLKNQRGKAIRFSTLTALCDALQCSPGDLFEVIPARSPREPSRPGASRSGGDATR